MGLFSKPKIGGDELQRCLAYYEAKLKVTAFQTKEADLFNNELVKYRTSKKSPLAASEVCDAANRLVQAAHEVKRRHEGTKPVPNAALATHYAWHITVLCNTAWAEATLQTMEALANGWTPYYADVQQLAGKFQLAQHEAEREDKKFLRRLEIKTDAIAEIISRSIDAAATDNWQPSLRGLWQNAKAGIP
jgi:hypothetical protein